MMMRRRFILRGLSVSVLAMPLSAQDQAEAIGIIMVGASWCPYCKDAAVQLHRAAYEWNWPVLIASLDDQPIPPFADYIPSHGHPLTRDVRHLPTTLVVVPARNEILAAFEGFSGPGPFLAQIATAIESAQGGPRHG